MKQTKELVFAILMIAVGLLLCILKTSAISWAVTILGLALIVVGILDIFVNKKDLQYGIIEIVIGALLVIFAWALTSIVIWLVAAVLVIYGAYGIYLVFKDGTNGKNIKSVLLKLLIPILYVLAGIFLFFNGFDWAFIIAGLILIIYGILELVKYFTNNPNQN